MSQSLSAIYIHATFGTKDRNYWINEKISTNLHAYMATILKNLNCPALIINSMPDHVHILFRMSKTVTIAQVIEEVKKSSSKWIKNQLSGTPSFYWQRGYGAFSVSCSHLDVVTEYIAHQNEHHKKVTYKEEIERLMDKYNVNEYEPAYYWS
ncbi:IS200/IS605 family transposase [Rhodohalobacter sulfatireducens]|uniref:IS200/IS605 family transposase n=1 Tax=Rhodohalobacter sulfatireducens TaxID=2911366 RepID=A0ABS9KE50_9BACT|nr:IS200/IS605 family transposase [Rhodohalobacter sulfatireducens]MCG2589087.1 IS200/IS605 family transposase [Rhodohalobacter sulfatireducens]